MTVLVVGNATVDLSYELERLPEPGETLLADRRLEDAGGKGLNQALMAHRAGAAVRLVAALGADAQATVIRRRLAEEGLAADWLVCGEGPTDQSVIWLAADGENVIVSTAEQARGLAPEAAAEALNGLGAGDNVLLQGNLARETTRHWLDRARRAGLHTLLNPAPIHFSYAELWPLVDTAIVNAVEARRLGGEIDPSAAAEAIRRAGATTVIVTLGAAGVYWTGPAGTGQLPAPAVRAVDTTGAGDVFCGVLAAALDGGAAMPEGLRAAVAAAALSVTRRGTTSAFPTPAELRRLAAAAHTPLSSEVDPS